jgi:hypothetical protein
MDICPTRDDLEQFVTERVRGSAAETLREHVRACPRCQSELDALSDDPELRRWHENLNDPQREHPLAEGVTVARIVAGALPHVDVACEGSPNAPARGLAGQGGGRGLGRAFHDLIGAPLGEGE